VAKKVVLRPARPALLWDSYAFRTYRVGQIIALPGDRITLLAPPLMRCWSCMLMRGTQGT
jgi:hypothetical protein